MLIFDEEEEYTEHIAALTEQISADGSDYVSFNNRGLAHFEIGELSAAHRDLTEACRLASHESMPFLNLTDVLRKMGDFQRALEIATEAIRIEPTSASGYFVRADVYKDMGDKVHADEDTKTAKSYVVA
jgi:tetratricopeptide (TPR) repeat protein